jgi:hypothetical protein
MLKDPSRTVTLDTAAVQDSDDSPGVWNCTGRKRDRAASCTARRVCVGSSRTVLAHEPWRCETCHRQCCVVRCGCPCVDGPGGLGHLRAGHASGARWGDEYVTSVQAGLRAPGLPVRRRHGAVGSQRPHVCPARRGCDCTPPERHRERAGPLQPAARMLCGTTEGRRRRHGRFSARPEHARRRGNAARTHTPPRTRATAGEVRRRTTDA